MLFVKAAPDDSRFLKAFSRVLGLIR